MRNKSNGNLFALMTFCCFFVTAALSDCQKQEQKRSSFRRKEVPSRVPRSVPVFEVATHAQRDDLDDRLKDKDAREEVVEDLEGVLQRLWRHQGAFSAFEHFFSNVELFGKAQTSGIM